MTPEKENTNALEKKDFNEFEKTLNSIYNILISFMNLSIIHFKYDTIKSKKMLRTANRTFSALLGLEKQLKEKDLIHKNFDGVRQEPLVNSKEQADDNILRFTGGFMQKSINLNHDGYPLEYTSGIKISMIDKKNKKTTDSFVTINEINETKDIETLIDKVIANLKKNID